MSAPLIKICGISTSETLNAAIDAGAAWIGLVHFQNSPRHIEGDQAKKLADEARGRAKIVSLLVDPDDALLETITDDIKPDILQLHGRETPQRVGEVKARFTIPVMKVIGIGEKSDLGLIEPYVGLADHILLDAKPPKDAVLPGGNGATFDWSVLDALPDGLPIVLSGGLTPQNVTDAVRVVNPYGVDVSSGVESAPGVKDVGLIRQFVEAAKTA